MQAIELTRTQARCCDEGVNRWMAMSDRAFHDSDDANLVKGSPPVARPGDDRDSTFLSESYLGSRLFMNVGLYEHQIASNTSLTSFLHWRIIE